MGAKNSSERRTEITNRINTIIKNTNETITDIVNTTINSATTNLTNEQSANIKSNNSIEQRVIADSLILSATGGFNQNAKISNKLKGLVTIVSDTALMTKLLNDIQKQLDSKITQDQKLQQTLAAAAKVTDSEKNAGGPEQMVNAAMAALEKISGSLTGTESNDKVETLITNEMNMTMENITSVITKTQDTVNNNIAVAIQNLTNFTCDAANSIVQEVNVKNINLASTFNQDAVIDNITECIFTATNGSKMITDISGFSADRVTAASEQTQSAEQKADTSATVAKDKENKRCQSRKK